MMLPLLQPNGHFTPMMEMRLWIKLYHTFDKHPSNLHYYQDVLRI